MSNQTNNNDKSNRKRVSKPSKKVTHETKKSRQPVRSSDDDKGREKRNNKKEKTDTKRRNKKRYPSTSVNEGMPKNLVEGDLRRPSARISPSAKVESTDQNASIPIFADLNVDAILFFVRAAIDDAVVNGWLAACPDKSYPFQALNYLVNAIIASATNGVPMLTTGPRYLANLMQALKGGKGSNGSIMYDYQWKCSVTGGSFVTPYNIPYGPNTADVFMAYGVPNGQAGPDGLVVMGSPTEYNPTIAINAVGNMGQFRLDRAAPQVKHLHEIVNLNEKNKFTTDFSAFAAFTSTMGGSSSQSGAVANRVGLEIPIYSSVFSHFTGTYQSYAQTNRDPAFNTRTGGGSSSIAMTATLIGSSDVTLVKDVKPKWYNIMEFIHVYAKAMYLAGQQWLEDEQNRLTIDVELANGRTLADIVRVITPNITFEEFAFAVRNEMMGMLSESQHLINDIYPNAQDEGGPRVVPLSTGVNSIHVAGTERLIAPTYFCEVAKGAMARIRKFEWNGQSRMNVVLTGLCMIVGDKLDDSEYVFKYCSANNTPYTAPLFIPVGDSKKSVTPQSPNLMTRPVNGNNNSFNMLKPISTLTGFSAIKARTREPRASLGVSLVDGGYDNGFKYINDPAWLNPIVKSINSVWVAVGPYVQAATPLVNDGGTDAFTSVVKTRYAVFGGSDFRAHGKHAVVHSQYGANMSVQMASCANPLVESMNCIPSIYPLALFGDQESNNSAKMLEVASRYGECHTQNLVITSETVPLSVIHYDMALKMVKQRDGDNNDITKMFEQANRKGVGGFADGVIDFLASPLVTGAAKAGINALTGMFL